MMRLAVLSIAAAVLTLGDSAQTDAVRQEKEKLQGMWRVAHDGGGSSPDTHDGVPVFQFTGDKVSFFLLVKQRDEVVKRKGSEEHGTYTLAVDKEPKTIDVAFVGGRRKGKTVKGIYAWNGPELKLALAQPQKARPTEFASNKHRDVEVLFLERVPAPAAGQKRTEMK